MEAVNMLVADALLPRRYFDHPLAGEWSDHRDCHIRPDLVLIYRK
jgi:mRNA interferase YafQ